MVKPIDSCGIYLDWDNIWGGILNFFSIKVDPVNLSPLTNIQKESIEKFIADLPRKLHQNLPDIRFIKAFADFDSLPYAPSLSSSITNILYNAEIEPHPSFVRAGKTRLKDASDRTLILEVIEDVFFTKKSIDCIYIGSGDVDFYPLVTFVREHSDKRISIVAFKNSLSNFYHQLSYLTNGGIRLLDEMMSDHKVPPPIPQVTSSASSTESTIPAASVVELDEEEKYEKFKAELVKGVQNWTKNKDREVKTGLVITSWAPRWGLELSAEKINDFLKRMKEDGQIDIIPTNPDSPYQGKIKIIK